MSELTHAMGLVIPYVNLVLVAVVLLLFFKLFKAYRQTKIGYITPWVALFIGVLVYVAEAIFTVLRSSGTFNLPYHVNGYFEVVIISLFIYAVLSLREHLKSEKAGYPSLFQSKSSKAKSKKPSAKPSKKKKSSRKKTSRSKKRSKKAKKKSSKK